MASWSGPQATWHIPTQPLPQLIPCYTSVPPTSATGPAQAPNTAPSEQTITVSTSQLLQRIAVLETELKIERENKSTLEQTCNYLIQQIRINSPQTPPQSAKRDEGVIRAHRKSIILKEKIRLQRTYIRHLKHTGNRTGDLLTSGDNGPDQLLGLPTLSPASRTSSSDGTIALWESGATTPIDRSEADALARQEEKGHQGLGIAAPEWKGKVKARSTGRDRQIPTFEPRAWLEKGIRAVTTAQRLDIASSTRNPPLSGQKALNPSAAAYVMPERPGNEPVAKPEIRYPDAPILIQSDHHHKAVRTGQANSVREERLIDLTISEGAEDTQSLAKSDAAPNLRSAHVVIDTESPTKPKRNKNTRDGLTFTQVHPPLDSPPDRSLTLNHADTEPVPNSPEDIELTKSILFYRPTPNDKNILRTVIVKNIPPTTSPSEVMRPVCGGPVLSIRYMNTLSTLSTNSALITFVFEESARAFTNHINTAANLETCAKETKTPSSKAGVGFGGIRYDLLSTPTFPPGEEEQNLIAVGRVTRCLSISNIPPRIPLLDLRAEFSKSEYQVDDGAVIGIERSEEGVVYLHLTSLLAAQRVFWRVRYCRRFGELGVRFEKDACDRPIPLVGCVGGNEGAEKDVKEAFDLVEEDQGQRDCSRNEEAKLDMVLEENLDPSSSSTNADADTNADATSTSPAETSSSLLSKSAPPSSSL